MTKKLIILLFFLALSVGIPMGELRAIETGSILGARVSKSGTVHLADVETGHDTLRSIYLPAGKLLLVYQQGHRFNARNWNLALTEDGIYIYVRTDGVHYYNPSENAIMQSGIVAVVQRPHLVKTEDGREFTLTPSEIYRVIERLDFDTVIEVDNAKLPELADATIDAVVPDDVLGVFDAQYDFLLDSQDLGPISIKSIQSDLVALGESLVESGFSEQTRNEIISLLNRRLITSKNCEQIIEGKWDFGTEVSVEINELLSPVEAKFGGGGSLGSSFEFPRGIAFEIDRFSRRQGGARETVIEVKNETFQEDCDEESFRRRLAVSTSRRETGNITESVISSLDLITSSQGFPILRCRDDYLLLYDEVTRRQTLSPDSAAFVLAHYTRFTGGARPADCR